MLHFDTFTGKNRKKFNIKSQRHLESLTINKKKRSGYQRKKRKAAFKQILLCDNQDMCNSRVTGFTPCEWIMLIGAGCLCGGTLFRSYINDSTDFTFGRIGEASVMSLWLSLGVSAGWAWMNATFNDLYIQYINKKIN